jgi:hypothetical protein
MVMGEYIEERSYSQKEGYVPFVGANTGAVKADDRYFPNYMLPYRRPL